jgi:peptidoglycan/LPS O-acetylase OafA/YrhL
MDQQLRRVPALLRRRVALALSERTCPELASGYPHTRHAGGHCMLVCRLGVLRYPGRYAAIYRLAGPFRLVPRARWNYSTLSQLMGTSERFLPLSVVYLDRVSYGLYVFHERTYYLVFHLGKSWLSRPCESLHLTVCRGGLGTILSFLCTILMVHLSYQFYERPFLHLKQRLTMVPSRG